jgi:hypothetical protein
MARLRTECWWRVTAGVCALALLFARAAMAQAASANEKAPAPSGISYAGGQLTIHALDSTLAEVLAKVAALTGVTIEVPEGSGGERMPVVELGPGTPRQVLASLLSDSNFDYVIQASDTDSGNIQSVVMVPREKGGAGTDATHPTRSRYAAARPAPAEEPVAENPPPAQPENAVAEAGASNPPPSIQPDQPPPSPLSNQATNSIRPGAMAPPQNLNPQNISQQLQQMYQQRMQMTQAQQAAIGTSPPAAGAK